MNMTQEELDAAIHSQVVKQMHSGGNYPAYDSLLVRLRDRSRILCSQINKAIPFDPTEYQFYVKERESNMRKLFGSVNGEIEIISPFTCDYGVFISLGNKVYMGAGCVILDCGPVTIHDEVLIGPGVHIYTVNHPLDPEERRQGWELTKPVAIHQNAWIGGHATSTVFLHSYP